MGTEIRKCKYCGKPYVKSTNIFTKNYPKGLRTMLVPDCDCEVKAAEKIEAELALKKLNKCDFCGAKLIRGYIKVTNLTKAIKNEEWHMYGFPGTLYFCDVECLKVWLKEAEK